MGGMVAAMALLDEGARSEFLAAHPGWELQDGAASKTFVFPGFAEAVGFTASVGVLAERAFHHPDIDIRHRRVRISLTTHDEGGLTRKDTEMAVRIDRLAGPSG